MESILDQLKSKHIDIRRDFCSAMLDTMYAIVEPLNGVADNGFVVIDSLQGESLAEDRLECLRLLAEELEVIELRYLADYNMIPIGAKPNDYYVSIKNRYDFEFFMLSLIKTSIEDGDELHDKSILDETPTNLVYYDQSTGRGYVNGKKVYLRGRNKNMFNALFLSAPKTVSTNILTGIARTPLTKYGYESDRYILNDALTAVRKACKTDSSVIIKNKRGVSLDARVFPLAFQLPHQDFRSLK